ncbi:helix-turn-helix domain-containing protein [Enterococcus faecium]|nr:helix-turn-helix domain-containing protein [Enterococcus faecium]
MFFNIVFTQKERRKLAIFHLLEEQHELTIKEISKKLDLSSSVVKNILNEMENEFDDFCFSGFKLLSKNKINQNLPIDLNYDYYYSYLIQQSLPYRAMKSSLFYPEKNLMEFCQENFISRASAMRHLQSLADYVQEFDVIFNRSQLSFKGDERLIRLILFNILWAASRGNEDYAFYVSKSELLK